MKKLVIILAIAGFATSCNSSSDKKLDTIKDSMVNKIDSAATAIKDTMVKKMDSTVSATKDSVKKM